jgi:HlyD family secretion protein
MKYNLSLFTLIAIVIIGCNNNDGDTTIEESGTIEMTNIIISSKASGEIERVLMDEGNIVRAGDTLAIIDNEILLLQLDQAKAMKKAARAKLDLVLSGARSEDINQAKQLQKQAEVNYSLAKTNLSRFNKLFNERVITRAQLDEIETKYQITLSQYNAAQANYEKLQNISREEEIEVAKANYAKAEASERLIMKQIEDTYVISPISGQVVESFFEMGESVTFMSSLFKVSNQSTAELVVYISETMLGKVKLGQKVDVTNDTYPDKVYEGTVVYISTEAEFTPKNIQTKDERTKLVFAVKIELPNLDYELKAGMPADAVIKLN